MGSKKKNGRGAGSSYKVMTIGGECFYLPQLLVIVVEATLQPQDEEATFQLFATTRLDSTRLERSKLLSYSSFNRSRSRNRVVAESIESIIKVALLMLCQVPLLDDGKRHTYA